MTIFSVDIAIGHPSGADLTEVLALADTGAHHSMMPESLLAQLHIQPIVERNFTFAVGGVETLGIGQARIAMHGEKWTCPVIFGPEGKYLLGRPRWRRSILQSTPVVKGWFRSFTLKGRI